MEKKRTSNPAVSSAKIESIERHLFGYADNIRVLKPQRLVKRMHYKLEMAAKQYDKDFHLARKEEY